MTRNACLIGEWSKGNATFNYLLRDDSSDRHNIAQQSTPTPLPYFLSPSFTLAPAERILVKESYDAPRPISGAHLPKVVQTYTPLEKIPPPKHYYPLEQVKRYKSPPSSPLSSLHPHHHFIEYSLIHTTFTFLPQNHPSTKDKKRNSPLPPISFNT